ncbi:NADH-quinone oxidoreductase subunit I [Poriferisphaera corsica]|uniref:NADH-quinone oxidoreductase subunit I n=1 Tax=Poriferisphaera corsica TaxID=2528020 RepID=A0A517YW26_9BACT|nr:NADH-quinone oxidoreductase subunit I [Poriferisphaera corsica]QDU34424.1 NADH-quinone oxidoreductase subunit I [Poriferisphaera corsica]
MPIRDEETVNVDLKPMTAAQNFYLPEVFKGLGTTFRHLAGAVGGHKRKTNRVMPYPEVRREDLLIEDGGLYAGNFRGVHRLNRDEEGRVRCVACFMCATACPANCIHIEGAESPWDDREKYPVKFDIDELRCIYCGMCEEACPVDAIELTPVYDIVGMTRQEMIFDKEKLLSIYDATIDQKPM